MLEGALLLGIDTCGPSGSVALARLTGGEAEILAQKELAGRSYSATLVASVGDLIAGASAQLRQIQAIVAVNGPGSFTGVRVGLSAVKGLAEVSRTPVVAVSRLEVLAHKAGVAASALDAHRGEVYLRLGVSGLGDSGLGGAGLEGRELLAGSADLAAITPAPVRISVCDEGAQMLRVAWPESELVLTAAPTAADALRLCAGQVLREQFVDLALLDGHYLRRSDAEIFGEPGAARRGRA